MEKIIKKLNEAFLPQNTECDGAVCMGCWKDVVREAIKMLEELPQPEHFKSIEEINDEVAKEYNEKNWHNVAVVLHHFNYSRFIELENEVIRRYAQQYQRQVELPSDAITEKIKQRMELLRTEKTGVLAEYTNCDNENVRDVLAERNTRISFELSFLNTLKF